MVKDGIIPGFYGYESGQSAVGDIFGWFAREFSGNAQDPFQEFSQKAALLNPGESGLVALDWLNGNRSVLMNADLSGMLLGLSLHTRPEEMYRELIEGTAFGTRFIIDSYTDNAIPVDELVVCGGLVRDPLIMQIYADCIGLPFHVAASGQAVALGSAILGAVAAGPERGGFSTVDEAIPRMTRPSSLSYLPDKEARRIYDKLYAVYKNLHDHFGGTVPEMMKSLKDMRGNSLGV